MAKIQLTQEIKAQILKENKLLTGTKHQRCLMLMKKFPYHRITLGKIIDCDTPSMNMKTAFVDDEKEAIIKCYNDSLEPINSKRLQLVADKFSRSTDAIRRIIRQQPTPSETKLFDHRKFYF